MKKVICYGNTMFSKILYYDLPKQKNPKEFSLACFCVDKAFIKGRNEFLGTQLVAFEDIQDLYPPDEFDMIVAFSGFNRMRMRKEKYDLAKSKGYTLRNYISSLADTTPDLTMGDNNIILGATHVGFGAVLGNDNFVWPRGVLTHEFKLGNHVEVSGGTCLGGECEIGDSTYLGMCCVIRDRVKVAEENLIGAGSVVMKDTEPFSTNVGVPSRCIGYHRETGVMM